jgi:hypothetical protein
LFESVSIPPAGQEAVVVDADAGAHLGRGKGIRRLNVFATAFIESLFSKNKKTIRIDCNFLRWK